MAKIENLVSEFSAIGAQVEQKLSDTLALVSGGRVPTGEWVEAFEREVEALREKYAAIQALTESALSQEAFPQGDVPVSVYVDLFQKSEAQRIGVRIQQAEQLLTRFLSIKSLMGTFEEALLPFQQEAAELLRQLQARHGDLPENTEQATGAQAVFFEALALEAFDTEAGIEIMEKVEALYPAKVQRGLLLKKYYIPENEAEPLPVVEQAPSAPVPQEAPPLSESPLAPEEPKNMLVALHKVKNATPSATAFKKDVLKLPREVATILPMFTTLGVLTADQLYRLGVCLDFFEENDKKRGHVYSALTALTTKNIMSAYPLENPGELAYCFTPYGDACMHKNSIAVDMRFFWKLTYGNHSICGGNEIESAKVLRTLGQNESLIQYFAAMKGQCSDADFVRLRSSVSWDGDHYMVDVLCEGESFLCAILFPQEAANDLTQSDVLFVSKSTEALPAPLADRDCFLLCDSAILKWDHAWVAPSATSEAPLPCLEAGPLEAETPEETAPIAVTSPAVAPEPTPAPEEATIALEPAPVLVQPTVAPEPAPIPEEVTPVAVTPPAVAPEPAPFSEKNAPAQAGESAYHQRTQPESPLAQDLADEANPKTLAHLLLEGDLSPAQHDAYRNLVEKLVAQNRLVNDDDAVENSMAQALILAKALALYDPTVYRDEFERLLMATDSPLQEHHYSGDHIFTLFENGNLSENNRPVLKLMTLLRALFAPETAYDYSLNAYSKSIFDTYEANFEGLTPLKPLYNLFLKIGGLSPNGFSMQVLRTFSDKTAEQELLRQIRNSAHQMVAEPVIKSGLKSMDPMIIYCFGASSQLRECMEIISAEGREDREYVELIYLEFCEAGEKVLSEEKLENFFEAQWKKAIHDIRGPRDLNPAQKMKVLENLRGRLTLIGRWLQVTESEPMGKTTSPLLLPLRHEILAEMQRALLAVQTTCTPFDRAVIETGLGRIREKLNGRLTESSNEFVDFLRTGVFCMDKNRIPYVDELFSSYQYYEPWRNALRHIAAPVIGLCETLEEISNPKNPLLFDNVGQALSICEYLSEASATVYSTEQYRADLATIRTSAQDSVNKFRGELELAFARGRISESVKEDVLEGVKLLFEKFDEFHNYGCLRIFLDTLRHTIDDATMTRLTELRQDVETRIRANVSDRLLPILDIALTKLEGPERNFVVAEEYINRYDAGITGVLELSESSVGNPFLHFIDSAFEELQRFCQNNSSSSFRSFAPDYVMRELQKRKVSAQYQDSGRALVRSMPNRPEDAMPQPILTMLRELGFDATNAQIVQSSSAGSTMVRLAVTVRPEATDKAEYAHPVDIMGTKLKSPVDVVCLFGRMQANDIVDKVCKLELSRTAIVFLNGTLDLQGRRQIAERFHRDKSGQNPFLLIDWVLLLHLALCQKTERLPILLSCTLPYASSFQPFVTKGSVPDEMFIGRKKELNQILDPKGPVIVYGGRQLGKTALLERASSLANHPSRKEYAVLVRAAEISTEEALVPALIQELNSIGLIGIPAFTTMRALCQHLRNGYRANIWSKLLILIDEADVVLEHFRDMTPAYQPIIPLSDLSRETGNDFKFVLAGLHNVCRAAADPNTIFGQLGAALCIKPLGAADAHELLSRPLQYLGFTIDFSHLEHLLVNTSFYPGIVHYVGYSLVENLSTRYADYYQASRGNPPYDLTDKQLGEIMSDDALNEKINERIRWTLQVDPRYFMLARCIAYLYYDYPENNRTGHSVDSVMEYAGLLGISCLSRLNRQEYMELFQELVEMGILVHPTEGTYRLRQRRFLDAIGSSRKKIEDDIQMEVDDNA